MITQNGLFFFITRSSLYQPINTNSPFLLALHVVLFSYLVVIVAIYWSCDYQKAKPTMIALGLDVKSAEYSIWVLLDSGVYTIHVIGNPGHK